MLQTQQPAPQLYGRSSPAPSETPWGSSDGGVGGGGGGLPSSGSGAGPNPFSSSGGAELPLYGKFELFDRLGMPIAAEQSTQTVEQLEAEQAPTEMCLV